MRYFWLAGLLILSGCVSAGSYRCAGMSIQPPIIPIGLQIGPCGLR